MSAPEDKSSTEQIECLGGRSEGLSKNHRLQYPFVPVNLPDHELSFISKAEVSNNENTRLWIVVDGLVYDCSSFVHDHPGGKAVIQSFKGQDCSWQFWRFHGKQHMQEYGRPLRVGKTSGVVNRFNERPKYVGLRRLGTVDDW
ncbi:hypothetical protein MBLNU459_g2751t1 [Dothideomycetes sp. NU459]